MRPGEAMRFRLISRQCGFTLVEMIIVIVITGIIAGIVAMFIRRPIEAYVDSARRAALTDAADTAARFAERELQGALPNSVIASGAGDVLEFVPIAAAGRYRAEAGIGAAEQDPLDFSNAADTSFSVLGPPVTVRAGDSLVVYNLGIANAASVYDSPMTVRRAIPAAGAGLSTITFTGTGTALPFPSPGSRFQIVGTPVAYACDLANSTLWRFSGYGWGLAAHPPSLATLNGLAGVTRSVVANHVSACGFSYAPGALQRFGLVSTTLSLTQEGETVRLQSQINVDNVP